MYDFRYVIECVRGQIFQNTPQFVSLSEVGVGLPVGSCQAGGPIPFSLTPSSDGPRYLCPRVSAMYFFVLLLFYSNCVVAVIVKPVKEGRFVRAGNMCYETN